MPARFRRSARTIPTSPRCFSISGGLAGQDAVAKAFEDAQWANDLTAAAALNQMAARTGAGRSALAALVRKQQDEAAEVRSLDKAIPAEVAKPANRRNLEREALVRARRVELQADLVRASAQISEQAKAARFRRGSGSLPREREGELRVGSQFGTDNVAKNRALVQGAG